MFKHIFYWSGECQINSYQVVVFFGPLTKYLG